MALAMLLTAFTVLPPHATQSWPALAVGTAPTVAVASNEGQGDAVALVAGSTLRPRSGPWADAAPSEVGLLADAVLAGAENARQAFIVIDKHAARLFVIDADGELIGQTPVLLGAARGDDSVPGIGQRPVASIRPFERTTPAGRFLAAAGRNAAGEDIVWIDYEAAISMHRVRAVDPREHRLRRLASATPDDNRISFGCINVPAAFFDQVIGPLFVRGPHSVYVLPEVKTTGEVFGLRTEKRAG